LTQDGRTDDGRTLRHTISSHGLWPGELKRESLSTDYVHKNEAEVKNLKDEIKSKEDRIAQLEEINGLLEEKEIECVYDGKFSNEIRETIMTLVTQCGVSLKKINQVIQTVVQNITGKSLSRLPSTGVRSCLLIEAKRVAQVQVVNAMLEPNINSNDTYYGNCLHQDGTSKFHRHLQSFQVTIHQIKLRTWSDISWQCRCCNFDGGILE